MRKCCCRLPGGLSGFDYAIQAATNLTGPIQWSDFGSAIASGAGTISFTDTNAPALPQRFQRLRPSEVQPTTKKPKLCGRWAPKRQPWPKHRFPTPHRTS